MKNVLEKKTVTHCQQRHSVFFSEWYIGLPTSFPRPNFKLLFLEVGKKKLMPKSSFIFPRLSFFFPEKDDSELPPRESWFFLSWIFGPEKIKLDLPNYFFRKTPKNDVPPRKINK